MYHILPDEDMDGVWDGDDICPDTEVGLSVNDLGVLKMSWTDDNDGYTNDVDDCDDLAGTSYLDKIGCPDQDGDGWRIPMIPIPMTQQSGMIQIQMVLEIIQMTVLTNLETQPKVVLVA